MRIHPERSSLARVIALVALFSAAVGVLAACGGNKATDSTTSSTAAPPTRHGQAVVRVGPVRLLRRFLDGNVGPNGLGRHRLARRRRPDSRHPVRPGVSAGICVRRPDEGDAEEFRRQGPENERAATRLPGEAGEDGDHDHRRRAGNHRRTALRGVRPEREHDSRRAGLRLLHLQPAWEGSGDARSGSARSSRQSRLARSHREAKGRAHPARPFVPAATLPLGSAHEDSRRRAGALWRAARGSGARPGRAEGRRGARSARRVRRLPHGPLHRLGGGSVRLLAGRARARRGRRRREGRRRSHAPSRKAITWSRSSRLSAASASTAATTRTNLCLAIREQQGLGYLPDGTTRLSRDGEPIRHFMGCSTFAEYTVMPEIALAKVEPGRAARPRLPVRLRPLDRARGGDQHREGRAGLDVRRLRRGHGRARRGRGLPAAGRRADRLRRPLRGAARAGARPGRDRHARRRARRRGADPRA